MIKARGGDFVRREERRRCRMTMNCKNRSDFAEWEGKIDSQEENIIIPLAIV
jgi:hypothetical protein